MIIIRKTTRCRFNPSETWTNRPYKRSNWQKKGKRRKDKINIWQQENKHWQTDKKRKYIDNQTKRENTLTIRQTYIQTEKRTVRKKEKESLQKATKLKIYVIKMTLHKNYNSKSRQLNYIQLVFNRIKTSK